MELFALPRLTADAGPDGWAEEVLSYCVRPRPKAKFKSVLDARAVFGEGEARFSVTTRVRKAPVGEATLTIVTQADLPRTTTEDRYECTWDDGLKPSRLERRVGESRHKDIDFARSPYPLPPATYPEVLLPFLMRGQPRDGKTRAAYAWTSDRFIARVYYEKRRRTAVALPKGRFESDEVWLYPDLNDWIALGGVVTKLVKPLLPRYTMWFEVDPPHRLLRFEGPFGPPGAPEIILELMGDD
jgi:hypothetical protein